MSTVRGFVGALYRRILHYWRKGRILALAHPLRTRYGLWLLLLLVVILSGRGFFSRIFPVLLSKVSDPIFRASQVHEWLGRFIHIAINAVPDLAYVLLALAGLGYLVPGFIEKLEGKLWARWSMLILFASFGFAAIVINAVNREAQSYKDGQSDERVGLVLKDVTNIQEALSPKNAHLTEIERREKLLTSLRDEYVLRPGPADPEILAGRKNPPVAWINERLRAMKEGFAVKDEPRSIPAQVVQQIAPEPKKAHIVFSFFQNDLRADSPKTVLLNPMEDNIAKVSISAIVSGDVPASDLHIWIRRCTNCKWLEANPPGFMSDTVNEFDRAVTFPKLEPNISTGKWDFSVQLPQFPKFESISFACYYACENCDTVDWKKPQLLWVTRTLQGGFRQLSLSVSQAPAPRK